MTGFLLVTFSLMLLRMLWLFLRGAFSLIEKAHEHLRESEPRPDGAELVRERAG